MKDKSLESIKEQKSREIWTMLQFQEYNLEITKKVSKEEADKLGRDLLCYLESIDEKKVMPKDFNIICDKVINYIIEGANIDIKNEKNGNFPLLICIDKDLLYPAKVLIYKGADINQYNNNHINSLMLATYKGYSSLVKLLIMLGADVNAKTTLGVNALMIAKCNQQSKCFDYLIKAQSSITHRNYDDESIFELPGSFPLEELDSFNPNKETNVEKYLLKEASNILTQLKKEIPEEEKKKIKI